MSELIRGKWIWDRAKGELVTAEEYYSRQAPPKRSDLACPYVIKDEMDPVQGQHNGKIYTSKRAIRASYRRHGVVEVGNDPQRFKKTKTHRNDEAGIKIALEKAEAKFNRREFTEATKRKLA